MKYEIYGGVARYIRDVTSINFLPIRPMHQHGDRQSASLHVKRSYLPARRAAKRIFLGLLGLLVAGLIPVEPAAAQTSTAPWDWIIQHICADASNRPVAVDPYGGCPAGTQDRRLGLQNSLPYWKHDQPTAKSPNGTQRHNSHPLRDRQFGGIISANDFDPHQPTSAAHHGYDVYRAVDGYVSSSATETLAATARASSAPAARHGTAGVFPQIVPSSVATWRVRAGLLPDLLGLSRTERATLCGAMRIDDQI